MEEFTYRLAELDDIPLILETEKLIKREMGWRKQKDIDDSIRSEEKDLPIFIKDGTAVLCFAYRGDTFAGMGGLYDWNAAGTSPGSSNLVKGYFYTVPEFRKRGVMHGIAEFLIRTAKERGCDHVSIYTEDKYRDALYARGFRDVYDEDEEDIPVIEDEMTLSLEPRQEDYQKLQAIRIPAGWTVGYNYLEDTEPEAVSETDRETWERAFREELVHIYYIIGRERGDEIEKQRVDIWLNWTPESDPDGEFSLWAIVDRDWYDPLLEFSSRSKAEIVKTLEKWLFVDLMPIRFFERDDRA